MSSSIRPVNPTLHKKTVRSFVRRQGRITTGQTQALQQAWPQYGLTLEQGLIDYTVVFGRQAPVVLEIGFGMGHSLVQQLRDHPKIDFIGIEVHRPGVGSLLAAAAKENLKNIRVYDSDAVQVLQQCIPDASLQKLQLFFPDPWPKKRHHKRRILQTEFVKLIHQKLKFGGQLHCATDWQDYAEYMLTVLSDAQGWENAAGAKQFTPRPAARPLTKFEKQALQAGRAIWDMVFTKVS